MSSKIIYENKVKALGDLADCVCRRRHDDTFWR